MSTSTWRRAVLVFLLVLAVAVPTWAQQRPNDATTRMVATSENPKEGDAEQDKPTERLEWQRQAWGIVTPAFRALD